MPIVIGLVGPSGSGKSTVCTYLEQEYGFARFHVAAPLKRAFCEMFRVPRRACEQPEIDLPADYLGGVAPRMVLEHWGTTLHQVAPEALPRAAENRARAALRSGAAPLLIDGLRRDTEGEMVHRLGGSVIRMIGREIDQTKPCDVSQIEVSEDICVRWSPSLPSLYREIDDIMLRLQQKSGP